jgi:ankyrin repeat protein
MSSNSPSNNPLLNQYYQQQQQQQQYQQQHPLQRIPQQQQPQHANAFSFVDHRNGQQHQQQQQQQQQAAQLFQQQYILQMQQAQQFQRQQQQQQQQQRQQQLNNLDRVSDKVIYHLLSFLSPFPYYATLMVLNNRWKTIVGKAWGYSNSILFHNIEGKTNAKAPLIRALNKQDAAATLLVEEETSRAQYQLKLAQQSHMQHLQNLQRYQQQLQMGPPNLEQLQQVTNAIQVQMNTIPQYTGNISPKVSVNKLILNNVQVNNFKKIFEQSNVKESLEELTIIGFRFTHASLTQFMSLMPMSVKRLRIIGCLIHISQELLSYIQLLQYHTIEDEENEKDSIQKRTTNIDVEFIWCDIQKGAVSQSSTKEKVEEEEEEETTVKKGSRSTRSRLITTKSTSKRKRKELEEESSTPDVYPKLITMPDWVKTYNAEEHMTEEFYRRILALGVDIEHDNFNDGLSLLCLVTRYGSYDLFRQVFDSVTHRRVTQQRGYVLSPNLYYQAIVFNEKYGLEIIKDIASYHITNIAEKFATAVHNETPTTQNAAVSSKGKKKQKQQQQKKNNPPRGKRITDDNVYDSKNIKELFNRRVRMLRVDQLPARNLRESIKLRLTPTKSLTPLLCAAVMGRIDMVQFILDISAQHLVGVLVQTPQQLLLQLDAEMNSALHLACYCGHHDIVKYLIEQKLHSVDILNSYRQTCLHSLFLSDHYEVPASEVINSIHSIIGQPPAHTISNQQLPVEKHRELLLFAADSEGNTACHYAARYPQADAFKTLLAYYDQLTTFVLTRDIIYTPNSYGLIPAFVAIHNNPNSQAAVAIVMELIRRRPDIIHRKITIHNALIAKTSAETTQRQVTITTLLDETIVATPQFGKLLLTNLFDVLKVGQDILAIRNEENQTILHRVINNPDVAGLLIQRGANVNAQDKMKRTPLHLAIEKYDAETVNAYLDVTGEPGSIDFSIRDLVIKENLLHYCAKSPTHASVVPVLVAKGANPNEQDDAGNTPLIVALFNEQFEHIDSLATPESINRANTAGYTPLLIALKKLHALKVAKRRNAAQTKAANTKREQIFSAVQKLLEHGPDCTSGTVYDIEDTQDQPSILMVAVESRLRPDLIEMILKKPGVDVNFRTLNSKLTPLHIAGEENSTELVELLLKYNASVYVSDATFATPLVYAISNSFTAIVDMMLNKIASSQDIRLEDLKRQQPDVVLSNDQTRFLVVQELTRRRGENLIENLTEVELDILILECVRQNSQIPLVQEILKQKKNSKLQQLATSGKNRDGNLNIFKDTSENNVNLLMVACQEGFDTIVSEFIQYCALFETIDNLAEPVITIPLTTTTTSSSVPATIQNQQPSDLTKTLKVVLDGTDSDGNAPLHYVMVIHTTNQQCEPRMKVSIIQELIQNGASANIQNSSGDTPLHTACKFGQEVLAHTLISNGGANLYILNYTGKKPEDIAAEYDHFHMDKVLGTNLSEKKKGKRRAGPKQQNSSSNESSSSKRRKSKSQQRDDDDYDYVVSGSGDEEEEDDDEISDDDEVVEAEALKDDDDADYEMEDDEDEEEYDNPNQQEAKRQRLL